MGFDKTDVGGEGLRALPPGLAFSPQPLWESWNQSRESAHKGQIPDILSVTPAVFPLRFGSNAKSECHGSSFWQPNAGYSQGTLTLTLTQSGSGKTWWRDGVLVWDSFRKIQWWNLEFPVGAMAGPITHRATSMMSMSGLGNLRSSQWVSQPAALDKSNFLLWGAAWVKTLVGSGLTFYQVQ